MHISGINVFLNYAEPFFNKQFTSLSILQKRVSLIAIVAFSCILACYMLYQIGSLDRRRFEHLDQEPDIANFSEKLNPVQEENIDHSKEINDLEKQYASLNVNDLAFDTELNVKDVLSERLETSFDEAEKNSCLMEEGLTLSGFGSAFREFIKSDGFAEYYASLNPSVREKFEGNLASILVSMFSDEEIYDYADLTFKNASSLEEARIILMGEDHCIREHKVLEDYIINRFGKSGDILLIETSENTTNTFVLKHRLHIYCWDNLELIKKGIFIVKKRLDYQEEQAKLVNDSDRFQELAKKIASLYREAHRFLVVKRNQVLIRFVKKCLVQFPEKKIFVVSGKKHLISGKYNILNYLPESEKYALVMGKDLGTAVIDDTEYTKQLVNSFFPSENTDEETCDKKKDQMIPLVVVEALVT